MLNSTSVKARFLVSIVANILRAIISFGGGVLVARGLNPSGYGDMMFLLGSFVAIRSLMDLGSSSAFYTFISQRFRSCQFYLFYYGWLALQYIVILLLITLIMPQAMIEKVWLSHSRDIILLAFTASFLQQQVWQTVGQIGEASRKTVKVQIMSFAIAIVHLIVVTVLLACDWLSIKGVLWLFILEYLIAIIWAYWFLKEKQSSHSVIEEVAEFSPKQMLEEYWEYCKPLVFLSFVGFLYDFADRWMLQRFGGSNQQGFYQIAYQFAAVSLLATTSILKIFWKEIAEANARQDINRVAYIYHKVNRALVMLAAILSGFMIPWSEQIVIIFLGQAYITAWPVLAIMFLYPIHQTMGQIGGTMFLASGHTKAYMLVGVIGMLISVPLSYLVQAPNSGIVIPGLGMGALGMALKMVLLGIISVNIQAWLIARYYGWKFDWFYQVVGIGSVVGSGYLAKLVVSLYWDFSGASSIGNLLIPLLIAGVLYLAIVAGLIWLMPWLVGMKRDEIKGILRGVINYYD